MGMLINIDNGGTLTDFCAYDGDRLLFTKTLTTPHDLSSCFFEGLTKLSDLAYGDEDVTRLLQATDYIRYSTTQGTNALVQRQGPRIGLLVSGEKAAAALRGGEDRAGLFDAVVGDRVCVVSPGLDDEALDLALTRAVNALGAGGANRIVVSLDSPDPAADELRCRRIVLRRFPSHLLGALPVAFAAEGSGDPDYARRTWTALLNAFLHPAMERFLYGAERRLKQHRTRNRLLIFRNDGGAARVAKTIALKTYSSGPRGGLEGARVLAASYGFARLLSIDVGGTTTDIGLIETDALAEDVHGCVEGIAVSVPLCRIHSEGVGGSSIIRAVDGAIAVGPASVGAAPGPACFGRGGEAFTMTDAALLNGMIDPATYFGGALELDAGRARAALEAAVATPLGLAADDALAAAEAAWVNAIVNSIEGATGVPDGSVLAGIGGGGPMLLTSVADALGIRQAIVPGMAPVFSAYGIGFSALSQHYQLHLTDDSPGGLLAVRDELLERAGRDMFAEGIALEDCRLAWSLVAASGEGGARHWLGDAAPPAPADEASVLRLEASRPIGRLAMAADTGTEPATATAAGTRRIRYRGRDVDAPLFRFPDLAPGAERSAAGPCVVEDAYFTARLDAGWRFRVTANRDLLLERTGNQ